MNKIKSMTGFASIRKAYEKYNINLDLKSVNSRYLEVNIKLNDELKEFEAQIRNLIKAQINRGKIECIVSIYFHNDNALNINFDVLKPLITQLNQLTMQLNHSTVNVSDLLTLPNVLGNTNNFDEAFKQDLFTAVTEAITQLDAQRLTEGSNLQEQLLDKLTAIEKHLCYIKQNLDNLANNERTKLKEKIDKLALNLDEQRLEQEIVLLAQKADIAEEYDRLCSHIKSARQILTEGGLVGKKLDFLMQEFNRESNTIASKTSDINITQIAVEIKVLIEQMREQVQNIE